jgi:hypothetical protein
MNPNQKPADPASGGNRTGDNQPPAAPAKEQRGSQSQDQPGVRAPKDGRRYIDPNLDQNPLGDDQDQRERRNRGLEGNNLDEAEKDAALASQE